jgi:hypothetical protein
MGGLLLWLGLTLILAVPTIIPSFALAQLLGALLMIVGAVLLLLGK